MCSGNCLLGVFSVLKKWLVTSVAAIMMVTGCSQDKEPVEEQPEKQVDEEIVKGTELSFQYPLSGLKTEEEPGDRAVAVVVNNHPKARPQSGLTQADIVYEVLAEGNVTRFLAIFESEHPEKIGPVRSARDYFIELAKGYDSLFIAHGYSPEAKDMLRNGTIDHLNGIQYDGSLFKRVDFRQAPHNSYISYENIEKGAKKSGYLLNKAPEALTFYKEEQLDQITGEETIEASVSYGNSTFDIRYEYDSDAEKYHRFSVGEDTVDLDSGESILLDNVFIVEMDHKVADNQGRKEIDLISGGRGYLLQKGVRTEVEWKNIDGRILPFVNGERVKLVPGKTWINIVPNIGQVTF